MGNPMIRSDTQTAAELLLSAGYDLEAPDFDLGQAVIWAATEGDEDVMRLLLGKGADANVSSGQLYDFPLQVATRYGHDRIALLLLDHGADINARIGLYGTALQAASTYGHHQTVALLLEHGADVNVYGEIFDPSQPDYPNERPGVPPGGATALHVAAQQGYDSIVQLLLDHGADPNAPGGMYGSVLDRATWHGHDRVIQLLLEYGARPNAI